MAATAASLNALTMPTAPLRVRRAATLLLLRRAASPAPLPLRRRDVGVPPAAGGDAGDGGKDNRVRLLFGDAEEVVFRSGWEVLMGQREVQNWLRSAPGAPAAMRYPGEWNFPGGGVEGAESLHDTAFRELQEEFGVAVPAAQRGALRLFSVKQTRPIQNKSNVMFNFVAAAEENEWLRGFNVAAANARLAARRAAHAELVRSGAFWAMPKREKERVAPEVRGVAWMDLRSAVSHAFTSMSDGSVTVNDFQRDGMRGVGVTRRDPMFVTMAALIDLERFPTLHDLRGHCDALGSPEEEAARVQWLRDGMAPEEVRAVFSRRFAADISPTLRGHHGMPAALHALSSAATLPRL